MKKVMKFQLTDLSKAILIYYLVMVILLVFGAQFSLKYNSNVITTNGTGFSSAFFCFIAGLCIFKEHFLMFMQNNISRKTYFQGTLGTIILAGVSMGVLELILTIILKLSSPGRDNFKVITLMNYVYPEYFLQNDSVLSFFITFIFTALFEIFVFIAGYLIAALFYRSGKIMKVVIAAGIPITLVFILPSLAVYLPSVWKKFYLLILIISGIKSQNPFIALFTLFIGVVIVILISYKVLKKAEV